MTDINKWWQKFKTIADEILQWDQCYCKEKYWRFDTTYYWDRPWVCDRLLEEVEQESEQCCQSCWEHRPQIWTDTWWIEHFCPGCYMRIKKIKIHSRKEYWKIFK